MLSYSRPDSVRVLREHSQTLLSTPSGGRVLVDRTTLALWEFAPGHTLEEIIQEFQAGGESPVAVRAGLACLSEAGLLQRSPQPASDPQSQAGPILKHPSPEDPLVSVIVVGYNSREWLSGCFSDLLQQTYRPLEILYVDNGSSDGSPEFVQETFPQVRLIRLNPTRTYSQANNQGIAAAEGDYYLLLNPDVRLQPDSVEHFVERLQSNPGAAAAAGKLKLLWSPAFLNGLGSYVGTVSWGVDIGLGHLDLGQFDGSEKVPAACFAAAMVRREAWEAVGPLDEGFPMYYEDSEWSYRAHRLGFDILAAPQAVVYHAFSSNQPGEPPKAISPTKLKNNIYGRLRFVTKMSAGSKFLLSYLLEDNARVLYYALRLRWDYLKAYQQAWKKYLSDFRSIQAQGKALRARQKRDLRALFNLQKDTPPQYTRFGYPDLTWDRITHSYLPLFLSGKTRRMPEYPDNTRAKSLLIVSHDVVDQKMAGTGLRYVELAGALAPDLEVTLAVPEKTTFQAQDFKVEVYQAAQVGSLQRLAEGKDVILISSFLLNKFPFLESTSSRLVVDLYDPFIFENLYYYSQEPLPVQVNLNTQAIETLNRLAQAGDYFICGSQRQRDFWIGLLAANGRINPHTFAEDASLHHLIDVVSVGIPARRPQHRPLLKNVHPAFPAGSQIVLWGGGIWNWLDPLTLIKSWPAVSQRFPQARLVFLGTRHPNPLVPQHTVALQAEKLAEDLGQKDKTIFFFEWLSVQDREALLCEADIGVTLHPVHAETRYSIRTRVLDYFWAGLPVLVSDGDVTSEWVRQYQVGEVVQGSDPSEVANAMGRLLSIPKAQFEPAFSHLRSEHQWAKIIQPLRAYCLEGGYAPDRKQRRTAFKTIKGSRFTRLSRAWTILRQQGLKAFLHRLQKYVQWLLSKAV